MNKVLKVVIIILCVSILLTGIVYSALKIIEGSKGKVQMTPTYASKISTMDSNKVWIGTFNLVWNDLIDFIGGKIEFEDGYSELAEELNKQTFTTDELSEHSYFKMQGNTTYETKNKIENGIKQKFNESSKVLDKIDWEDPKASNGYVLYAMLKKEFNFLEKFPTLQSNTFGNSEEKVKYFGLEPDTSQEASKNIEILFYNSKDDFAVKLKTKEGEEVYLYRTTGEDKSFEEIYQEMKNKESEYSGSKEWKNIDYLKIPFIKLDDIVNYDELCGRFIKGTDYYINLAMQTIEFELNNYGGSVKSEAVMALLQNLETEKGREFIFNDDFILYLKEDNKEKPYFALKVDDVNILQASDSE